MDRYSRMSLQALSEVIRFLQPRLRTYRGQVEMAYVMRELDIRQARLQAHAEWVSVHSAMVSEMNRRSGT
jgi:hypothetical protein